MSNLSIFDQKWIDVVFEGKNKEYGAYQLRHDNEKTTVRAFGLGIVLVLSSIGIFTLSSFVTTKDIKPVEPEISVKLKLTDLVYPKTIVFESKKIQRKFTKTYTNKAILVNPVVTQVEKNEITIATNKDLGTISNIVSNENNSAQLLNESNEGTNIIAVSKIPNNDILSTKNLDKQPSFPNGIDKFYNYIGNNFKNPEIGDELTITVKVSFVVEKDGSISNIKVSNDPGYGLANEAIRVLKSLKTKWSPGILNGEAVRTAYNLPIVVKLE